MQTKFFTAFKLKERFMKNLTELQAEVCEINELAISYTLVFINYIWTCFFSSLVMFSKIFFRLVG